MLHYLDGTLFLKKRLICACLRCFSLLIVLLESMMQCVVLLFCCIFIIADCQISKNQVCSTGCLLAGGCYRDTEAYVDSDTHIYSYNMVLFNDH